MSRARVASLASVVLLLAAGLGACARLGPPAPVVQGTSVPPPRAVASAREPARVVSPGPPPVSHSAPGETLVKPGESLYLIARRHNVPMRALIDANGLEPPYVLHTGQRLTLPAVRTYRVQSGDTLSGIARRFGLGTSEMVRANALAPPHHVLAGQVLILPGGGATPLPGTPSEGTAVASTAPFVPAPRTVDGAPLPAIASPPPAQAPAAAQPGPARQTTAVPDPAPASEPQRAAEPPPPEPLPVAAVPPPLAPQPEADDPPAKSGRGFVWPVRGTIVSDYGSKPGGLQNDGINIAAPRGTPIRVAESGTVIYAGNELRGFGNLLLVRHRDGWITAYAHADELLVKRGAEVRRGQVIARVGASGAVSSPQLHFEVRKGSRHVNPRDYLAPQTAQVL